MGRQLRSVERRRQSRRNASARRNGCGTIVLFVMLFLILSFTGAFYVYQDKFAPSKKQADLEAYFGVSGDDVAVYLNEETEEDANGNRIVGKYVNGSVYLPYVWVMKQLNRRFYYESDENSFYYTTQAGTEIYTADTPLQDGSMPFIKTGDGEETLYLNEELVEQYTDIRVHNHVDGDEKRIFLYTDWKSYTEATLNKEEAVRVLGGIKSDVLTTLPAGSKVKILDTMEKWSQVVTEDGFIGYLRNKTLTKKTEIKPESTFTEEEFHYLTRGDGQKVVLGFHQVTNVKANEGFEKVTAKTAGMNTIAPTWFELSDDTGAIESNADASYVTMAHQKGLQVYATVNNFENGKIDMKEVLGKSANRKRLISELIAQAKQLGIDGINIDFESIPESCGRDYVQFMREFSNAAHAAQLVASCDVYVPFEFNRYYDIEEIGKFLDYVIVMCYDEHYAGGEAGSVSSIGYVEHGIERTIEQMDRERVVIALPFYTRIWTVSDSGNTTSEAEGVLTAGTWAANHGMQFTWDDTVKQNYGEIRKEDAVVKCWMEDERSITEKMKAVREANVGGVAAWKLGQEPENFWPIINLNA